MKLKNSIVSLLCFSACLLTLNPLLPVSAEEYPDFSDTTFWNDLCTGDSAITDEEAQKCRAYMDYIQEQNQQLQEQISEIDTRKEQLSSQIADYNNQLAGMNAQVEGINGMITDLNYQIQAVEEQVADIHGRIESNQKELVQKQDAIDSLVEKVSDRMVEQQKTMRLHEYIDILMGSESFAEFLRLASGINAIYQRDNYSLTELNDNIEELEQIQNQLLSDQEEVEAMEAELEQGRQALSAQQAALLSTTYELQVLQQNYYNMLAQAESEQGSAAAAISSNQSSIAEINNSLSTRPSASASTESSEPSKEETSESPSPSSSASPSPSPSSTPSASPSPSPSSSPISTPAVTSTGNNPYYGGWSNCTWGAWQLTYDTLGISLPGWGMAGNWLNDARASGYATGSTPRVYSIAVYSWHVAFVTAIDGDMVYIKEGNYLGHYYERWVPVEGLPYTGQSCLGYIYL
ncbi:MAG: CHAP domain-containing protein [Solobacterium sp.]|nr:CHAP domain-containing protein [Solobacterium sp.]